MCILELFILLISAAILNVYAQTEGAQEDAVDVTVTTTTTTPTPTTAPPAAPSTTATPEAEAPAEATTKKGEEAAGEVSSKSGNFLNSIWMNVTNNSGEETTKLEATTPTGGATGLHHSFIAIFVTFLILLN